MPNKFSNRAVFMIEQIFRNSYKKYFFARTVSKLAQFTPFAFINIPSKRELLIISAKFLPLSCASIYKSSLVIRMHECFPSFACCGYSNYEIRYRNRETELIRDFFPCLFFKALVSFLTYSIYLSFHSCCFHEQVLGTTLLHEFHISYSHAEWFFLFLRGGIVFCFGQSCVYPKLNYM